MSDLCVSILTLQCLDGTFRSPIVLLESFYAMRVEDNRKRKHIQVAYGIMGDFCRQRRRPERSVLCFIKVMEILDKTGDSAGLLDGGQNSNGTE